MRRSSDRSKRADDDVDLERLAGRVQVLAERVDTLAQTVATASSASARTDGEIAVLRRELDSGLAHVGAEAAKGRSEAGADEIRELRAQLSALAADRAKTADAKRIDDLSGKVAVLAQRVDTLAATVATAAASVAGRDGEVAALRRQLEQGGRAAPALDDRLVRRVQDAVSASATTSMRVEHQREQLEALIGRMETRDGEVRSALAELRDLLAGLAPRLAALEAMAEQRSRVDVSARLEELAGRLEALSERRGAEAPELRRATSLLPTAVRALESTVEQLGQARQPERRTAPPTSVARPTETAHATGDVPGGLTEEGVHPDTPGTRRAEAELLPFRGTST